MALEILEALPNGNYLVRDTDSGVTLERPVSDIPFGDVLRSVGASEDIINRYGPLLEQTRSQVALGTPEARSFELPAFESFRGAAEESIGPFFDKELDLLNKTIETSKRQQTKRKEVAEERIGEEEESFFNVEDIGFARALESAQEGFSGRGTFRSGFRQKAIGRQIQGRQIGLEEAEQAFGQAREDVGLGFGEFLENLGLREEESRLGIERRQESARLTRQSQLQQEELLKRLSEVEERGEFLSESLNQSLGA